MAIRQGVARTAVVLIILLAAALRFQGLGAQSLWNDEGASVVMAHRTLPEIAIHAAADIHPPGYYALLSGWVLLTGDSELALRMLSALESVLTVALVYALGRRLFGVGAGESAALLLAGNSFAIYYAQEARMYAQLALLSAAGMWALLLWLSAENHSPQRTQRKNLKIFVPSAAKYLAALALINAAGLYTQYAYPFSMVAQGAIFLGWWLRRRDGRTLGLYVAANLGTLILFAPWAGTAIRQVMAWPNTGMGADPVQAVGTLIFGWTAAGQGIGWAAWIGAAALAISIFGMVVRIRHAVSLSIPILWAILPVGAFLALRMQPDDLKSALTAVSALALWLAGGASALWKRQVLAGERRGLKSPAKDEKSTEVDSKAGLQPWSTLMDLSSLASDFNRWRLLAILAVLSVFAPIFASLPALYTDPAYARDDYRAMAARVAAEAHPGDAVILDGPGQGEVWSYYDPGLPVYPLPRGLGGNDAATRAEVEQILRDHRRLYVLFWGETERDPNGVVESTLDVQAFEVESRWYGDVRFVVYAVPGETATEPSVRVDVRFGEHITLIGYALDRDSYRPGDVLMLTLFWQTDASLSARYKVFVHLYADPDAPPPAQHDSEPGSGLFPTTDWQAGETVIDRHGILIPPDLPLGEYTLAVGLYDAADPLARLSAPQGERLSLGVVHLEP